MPGYPLGERDDLRPRETPQSRNIPVLEEKAQVLDQIVDGEKELRRDNTKLLTAIGLLYGKDSPEYEAAGGTRTSEAGK